MKAFIDKVINTEKTLLLFDHDLGGGTTKYREEKIATFLQQGFAVLLVISTHRLQVHSVVMKFYQCHAKKSIISESEKIDALALFTVLENINFQQVIVNSLVSFKPATLFVSAVAKYLHALAKVNISIAFHDYYALCPSFNLLNYQWQYCDVPDEKTCNHCQKLHPITTLREPNAENWRKIWGELLALADHVLAFSHASERLIVKAYPSLKNKITVEPHNMAYFAKDKIDVKPHKACNIGVVGNMALHKGSEKILALSDHIAAIKSLHNIVVFGEFEAGKLRENIKLLGAYSTAELSTLIEQNSIDVFFFPSICPETFSYVVEELMILDLTIVCFNLGAQAEKVASYAKGTVIELDTSIDKILQSLSAFKLKNV